MEKIKQNKTQHIKISLKVCCLFWHYQHIFLGEYIYGDVVVFNSIIQFNGYNTVGKRILMLPLIILEME